MLHAVDVKGAGVSRPLFSACQRCGVSCRILMGNPRKFCDDCHRKIAAERAAKWYQKNKERAIAYRQRPDVVARELERRRLQPKDHPTRIARRERARAKRQSDAERVRARERTHNARRRQTPKIKAYMAEYLRLRRAQRDQASFLSKASPALALQIKQIYLEAQRTGLTVDHIIPLKHRDVCGLHVPWNLQLLPFAENVRKNNRFHSHVINHTGDTPCFT